MKRLIAIIVTAGTASLGVAAVSPASAVAGDTIVRHSCITVGGEHYTFVGCASLDRNDNDRLVAKGYADNAGTDGEVPIVVRVTNIRLQTQLCGLNWRTTFRSPDKDGWWDREWGRTKSLDEVSSDGHRYRARVTVAWKYHDGSNRHTRTITSRPFGTC